jgi:hypothetical protein
MAQTLTVPLFRVAHSRAGDKGNRSNISVIATRPEFFDLLVEQVTAEAVRTHFGHRNPSGVDRYLVPSLHAMNFVIDEVLDGGVNQALNLDSHGKGLSAWMIQLQVQVPASLAPLFAGPAP